MAGEDYLAHVARTRQAAYEDLLSGRRRSLAGASLGESGAPTPSSYVLGPLLGEGSTPTAPPPSEPFWTKGLEYLHTYNPLTLPGRAIGALSRASARNLFGIPVSEEASPGSMLRAAVGLAPEQVATEGEGYVPRLAGRALEFGTDIALDPLTWALGGAARAAGAGRTAARALAAGEIIPDAALAAKAAEAITAGRRAAALERAAAASFVPGMTAGGIQEGADVRRRLETEGFTPAAAESALGAALAGGMAAGTGLHALGLHPLATPDQRAVLAEGARLARLSVPDLVAQAQAREAAPRGILLPSGEGALPSGITPDEYLAEARGRVAEMGTPEEQAAAAQIGQAMRRGQALVAAKEAAPPPPEATTTPEARAAELARLDQLQAQGATPSARAAAEARDAAATAVQAEQVAREAYDRAQRLRRSLLGEPEPGGRVVRPGAEPAPREVVRPIEAGELAEAQRLADAAGAAGGSRMKAIVDGLGVSKSRAEKILKRLTTPIERAAEAEQPTPGYRPSPGGVLAPELIRPEGEAPLPGRPPSAPEPAPAAPPPEQGLGSIPTDVLPAPVRAEASDHASRIARELVAEPGGWTVEALKAKVAALPEHLREHAGPIYNEAMEEANALETGHELMRGYRERYGPGQDGVTRVQSAQNPDSYDLVLRHGGQVAGVAEIRDGELGMITGGREFGSPVSAGALFRELVRLGVKRNDILTILGTKARRRYAARATMEASRGEAPAEPAGRGGSGVAGHRAEGPVPEIAGPEAPSVEARGGPPTLEEPAVESAPPARAEELGPATEQPTPQPPGPASREAELADAARHGRPERDQAGNPILPEDADLTPEERTLVRQRAEAFVRELRDNQQRGTPTGRHYVQTQPGGRVEGVMGVGSWKKGTAFEDVPDDPATIIEKWFKDKGNVVERRIIEAVRRDPRVVDALEEMAPKYATRPLPGQRGLPGVADDQAVAREKPKAPEQRGLFGAGELMQPTEAKVTEGREGEGPLFQQEAEARAKAAREAQGGLKFAADERTPWGEKDKETGRKFSSTQVDLPSEIASKLKALGERIPERDRSVDPNGHGRETEPHVTVKFGLHTNDEQAVRAAVAGIGPVRVRLGKTSLFPAKEGAAYDVVKTDVESPDLARLNAVIAKAIPNTDTHPEYKPHATVAYVKPGLGKKYAGSSAVAGLETTIDKLTFSTRDGREITIPLTGERAATVLTATRQMVQERFGRFAQVTEQEGGRLRVQFRDGGGDVFVEPTGEIRYDPKAFEAGRGREMTAGEQIVGSSQKLGADLLIRLRDGDADAATLGHEELHGLLALGRLRQGEVDALWKEHGYDPVALKPEARKAAFAQAEERVADTIGALIRDRMAAEREGRTVQQPGWFVRLWENLKRLWSAFRPTAESAKERITSGRVYEPQGALERGAARLGEAARAGRAIGEGAERFAAAVKPPGPLGAIAEKPPEPLPLTGRLTPEEQRKIRPLRPIPFPTPAQEAYARSGKPLPAPPSRGPAPQFEAHAPVVDSAGRKGVVIATLPRDQVKVRFDGGRVSYMNARGLRADPSAYEFREGGPTPEEQLGAATRRPGAPEMTPEENVGAQTAAAKQGRARPVTTGKPPELPFNVNTMNLSQANKDLVVRGWQAAPQALREAKGYRSFDDFRQSGIKLGSVVDDKTFQEALKNGAPLADPAAVYNAKRILDDHARKLETTHEALRKAVAAGRGVQDAEKDFLAVSLEKANFELAMSGAQAQAARTLTAFRILADTHGPIETMISELFARSC